MNHEIIRKIEYFLPFQFIQIEEQNILKQGLLKVLQIIESEFLITQIKESIIILVLQASKDQCYNIPLHSYYHDFISICWPASLKVSQ
jgi:hypothetical protein